MVATLEKTLSHTAIKATDNGLDLFFYDANLEGRDNLLPYISENSKLVPVKRSENFLTKLVDFSSNKINTLYILCHGAAGELKIGSEKIDKESLIKFSENKTINIKTISLYETYKGNVKFIR